LKGTKLWQDTGSALISGYSRHRRPFWRDWLTAAAAAFAGAFLVVVAIALFNGTDPLVAARLAWIPALAGALIGAAPGVWLAGKLGSLKRWQLGAVVGLIFGVVLAFVFAPYLAAGLAG